ncbi:hypothetical protein ACFV3R_32260 [Streptomyces sp. NPDC059740]|uniref:hypothetical protein n=1 Tax=Streptomyces sp. NPDC059740 TaxID=3346926 RepID=UPI00364BD851
MDRHLPAPHADLAGDASGATQSDGDDAAQPVQDAHGDRAAGKAPLFWDHKVDGVVMDS